MIPNRDSKSYIDYYGVDKTNLKLFLRGTLRFPGFLTVFRAFKKIGLFNEVNLFDSENFNWFDCIKNLIKSEADNKKDLKIDLEKYLLKQYQKETLLKNKESDIKKAILSIEKLGFFEQDNYTNKYLTKKKKSSLMEILCENLQEKLKYEDKEKDLIYMHHGFYFYFLILILFFLFY
jgi:hypothetical protein